MPKEPDPTTNERDQSRLHFATLHFATNLGIMARKNLIAAADRRMAEMEIPEGWLIELSTQGESSKLNQLAQREFKHVGFEVLRMAYRAWCERALTDAMFHQCCKELLRAGADVQDVLSWVDDEFDLAANGIGDLREARRKVRLTMERTCHRLPRDGVVNTKLLDLHTFAGPLGQGECIFLFLDFPVPKHEEFRDWWKRRGPALIKRPDGYEIAAVVEFQVGLLQPKGIRDLKNFKPEDASALIAIVPDVAPTEAPVGSRLLVTPELWNLILG